METKDMPHGIVGYDFAQALIDGDFEKAHSLLGPQLKSEYTVQGLRESFDFWIGKHIETGAPPEIEVMDNRQLGDPSLDDKGWAYVPIWSEAVTVTVERLGDTYLITDLVWGRP